MSKSFDRLIEIMNDLREQCPWDRKQTIHTLRQMTIEETYELADAISDENWPGIREELGDLLLHMVFYARIGKEQQQFDIDEVIDGICKKLIRRHPHIYAPETLNEKGLKPIVDEQDVKQNWEQLKLKEGKKSVLSGVPKSLPSMVKAMRLQEKAAQVGFDWERTEDVWAKVREEMEELQQEVSGQSPEGQQEELGDLLFSLVNYARFLKIDAEAALEAANKKFMKRFSGIEAEAAQQGRPITDLNLTEMDAIWNQQKPKKYK
ncbi:nucleoside triphosphate pyrophosphohydrolase [Niabella terrae]